MRTLWVVAVLLVSGCILHSKTPIFAEADAVPILGTHPHSFAVYDLKDGVWVATADLTVRAVPSGRHYTVADPSAENPARLDSYAFIPLDATRYVVQAFTEGNLGADYAIATWDGRELLVSPLACDRLKTSLKTNDLVGFLNDSCALYPSPKPPLDLFAKLALRAGPPTLRFVRQ